MEWGGTSIEIAECPCEYARDAGELIDAIDMVGTMPPVLAGFLDQTAMFVDGLRFWRAEESRWRRHHAEKKPNG